MLPCCVLASSRGYHCVRLKNLDAMLSSRKPSSTEITLANITIRNLPDELHERLRAQAEANKRSLESEVRSILTQSVIASSDGGFGQRMRARYGDYLGDELSVERDQSTSRSGVFSDSSPRRK